MTRKVLIISDLHNRHERAERIIRAEGPDLTIFLGDVFDDFGDNAKIARKTALWLKNSLTSNDRIFLMGNHDLHYAYPKNHYTHCSGFELAKSNAISEILEPRDWNQFRWYYFLDDILLTHAGLTNKIWRQNKDCLQDFLDTNVKIAENNLQKNRGHWLYAAGRARGGSAANGGITWCDWEYEFAPIPEQPQIVGHTILKTPQWKENSLCLDTNSAHYAIYEKKNIQIKEYKDL